LQQTGGTINKAFELFIEPVNSLAPPMPTATENPPAATLVARCVADSPANLFPNHPATAL
jgi:hypothetical protein